MKKLFSILLVLCIALSLYAAEPLVTVSTVVPGMISVFLGDGEYDVAQIKDYVPAEVIALPFLVEDSGLSLYDIISDSLLEQGTALWDAFMLGTSLSDVSVVDGKGVIATAQDIDTAQGTASLSVRYDDVSLFYNASGWTDSAYIDGEARASLMWKQDALLVISVDADTTLSGKSNAELSFYLDEATLDAYLDMIGMDKDEMRRYAAELVMYEFSPDIISYILGTDINSLAFEDAVDLLERENMLDILDYIGFFALASDNPSLSQTDPITMCLVPRLAVDGSAVDLDLVRLMKQTIQLMGFADNL